MSDTQIGNVQAVSQPPANEGDLIGLLIILAKHKKVIIGLPLISAIVAALVCSSLPNIYSAGTKLLPPQQPQAGAAALLSQLGGVASAVGGAAGLKNPNDVYIAMLKSRTVADKLIKKFDLAKQYGTDSPERTRKRLEADTTVATGKDGLITVDVEGQNSKLVAQLANAYVDELLNLTTVLAVTEAAQRRKFFERQLELSKNNLAAAEMSLKSALDTSGVISVDSDSRAMLETIGRLRAQISAKEIQLGSMEAFVTTGNQDYKRTREELNSLKTELSKLENGRPATPRSGAAPEQRAEGLANIKLLRDVKYYQMLYELLAKQYEVARLDEAKDSSIIQVLDVALEPERKIKPRRLLISLVAAMVGLFVGVGLAFLLEARVRLVNRPGGAAQWNELKSKLWLR